jgi:hypothetical protein
MVIQFVIVGLLVFLGLFYLKMEHHGRRYKAIIIVILGFLIYFSVVSIFSSEQVDLSSPRGVVNAVYVYFGWMGHAASNLWDVGVETVGMVGNAVKINNSEDQQRR